MQNMIGSESSAGADRLPISRVVSFTTGVAFFEHSGVVEGEAELELTVPAEDMDDLLQSLVMRDLGGGLVEAARYASRDPLERVLRSYALDLSAHPSLSQLLTQSRGEPVRVALDAEETVAGVVVGVENEATDGSTRVWLTVNTHAGVRRVDLAAARGIEFERAETREQFAAALAALARYRDATGVRVRLRFSGEGERPVRVGYLRKMPVWKTSYRLSVEGSTGDLQGWAIFDNPTNLDLVGARLVFVAGRPASFVSQLFEPVWVERPGVPAADHETFVPPRDAGMFRWRRPQSKTPPEADELDRILTQNATSFGSLANMFRPGVDDLHVMAEGVAGAASFAYAVEEPVSVGRYESALVPILQARVESHELALFDARVDRARPLRSVRIVNDTGGFLAAGPVAVFDPDGFAGMARMGDVPVGEERVLSFAVDIDVHVQVEQSSRSEFVALRLAGGSAVHEERTVATTAYHIVARPGIRRFVVIDHVERDGFEMTSPSTEPARTPTGYRFGVRIGALEGQDAVSGDPNVPVQLAIGDGAAGTLEVVEERVLARAVRANGLNRHQAVEWLKQSDVEQDVRAWLEAYVATSEEIERTEAEIADLEGRRKTIVESQERVRENMRVLTPDAPLYARYAGDLSSQEDELVDIKSRVEHLTEECRGLQRRLREVEVGAGGREDSPSR
jgi:hypothetical protein